MLTLCFRPFPEVSPRFQIIKERLFVSIDDHRHEMPPCLSTVASRIAFCHQPSSFVATATRCRLMSPTVVSCRRPRTSFVFSNRCCHMHTPHMMNVTLKIVAAQLWRNPERFAQPEEATGQQIPTQNRIGPGARMDTEIARS